MVIYSTGQRKAIQPERMNIVTVRAANFIDCVHSGLRYIIVDRMGRLDGAGLVAEIGAGPGCTDPVDVAVAAIQLAIVIIAAAGQNFGICPEFAVNTIGGMTVPADLRFGAARSAGAAE